MAEFEKIHGDNAMKYNKGFHEFCIGTLEDIRGNQEEVWIDIKYLSDELKALNLLF